MKHLLCVTFIETEDFAVQVMCVCCVDKWIEIVCCWLIVKKLNKKRKKSHPECQKKILFEKHFAEFCDWFAAFGMRMNVIIVTPVNFDEKNVYF